MDKDEVGKRMRAMFDKALTDEALMNKIVDTVRAIIKYGPYDFKLYNSCYDCAGGGCSSCDYTGDGT